MKQWLVQLSPRERTLLTGGIAVLLLSGLYAFAYRPMADEHRRIQDGIQVQQQLNAYLQAIGTEVADLRQAILEMPAADNSQSAMNAIDTSSGQLGVKSAIKRLAPESQDKVGVWFENCAFDKLISWLAVLDQRHGIKVKQIGITRETGDAGLVRGRILLGR